LKIADVLASALQNLRRQKLRTALTVVGIAVGVGAMTSLVSLGLGLEAMATDMFQHNDVITRLYAVPKGSKEQLLTGLRSSADEDRRELDDEAVAELASLPGVKAAFPDVKTTLTLEIDLGGPIPIPTEVVGLPADALDRTYDETLAVGDYWTTEDAGNVCVLPSQLIRQELNLEPEDLIGQTISFAHIASREAYEQTTEVAADGRQRMTFTRPDGLETIEAVVVGVYDSKKRGLTEYRQVHVPMALGKELQSEFWFRREGAYNVVVVKVTDRNAVEPVQKKIEAAGFDVISIFDTLAMIRSAFVVFNILLAFFGSVGIFVASFGIANTMVMTVVERTREIGVLKALGGRNRDVRRLFLAEAAALGMCGGALGVFGGWVVGLVVNAIATSMAPTDMAGGITIFLVPWWLALGSVGLGMLVATLAGLYPAWRAARLDPAVTLRME
jgi:putative ABC transport system permease protein